jgi:imidazolonepropionase-like amidohydrolase
MAESIRICAEHRVKLGLGADLLDTRFHQMQGWELSVRGEINSPLQVLRSATSINAVLLQMERLLGCIRPGGYGDLLLINGDPTRDLRLFRKPDAAPRLIMKGGTLIANRLRRRT